MVNAWSLAASVLDGTLDEDYPIMKKDEIKIETSADEGVVNVPSDINLDDSAQADLYGYEPDRPDPFVDAFDHMMEDEYPSEFTTLSDNDDQMAHHIGYEELNLNIQANSPYNDVWTQDFYKEELAKMSDSRNKYHENEILKDVEEYVTRTYNGHYTGTKHEYRNVQTIDLMASRDLASDFCQANILKYGSRYGSKDGRNKKDLLKVIHYAMLLLHFDEHYGKPSMTSGNIDHNMP